MLFYVGKNGCLVTRTRRRFKSRIRNEKTELYQENIRKYTITKIPILCNIIEL